MRIIISPAKKMNQDTDSLAWESLPRFLPHAQQVKQAMNALSASGLQALWNCNDSIATLNVERLHSMNLQKNLTPALLAYEGIQYRCMAPTVFTQQQWDFVQQHLRIVSGFYGLLRPLDGIVPYRLEMQAALQVNASKDLYDFWGSRLAAQLESETDLVLNLASKEYSRAVLGHLSPGVRVITCRFGQLVNGKIIEKGTLCKMARGEMVGFLAESAAATPQAVQCFNRMGFYYSPEHSSETEFVFIKGE